MNGATIDLKTGQEIYPVDFAVEYVHGFDFILLASFAAIIVVVLWMVYGNPWEFLFSSKGRFSRSQFWLATILIWSSLSIFAAFVYRYELSVGLSGFFSILLVGLFLLAHLVVSAKRCHDRERSGWFQLCVIVPLVGIVWLIFELGLLPGRDGANRYGYPFEKKAKTQFLPIRYY